MTITKRGKAAVYSIRFHDHNRTRRQLRGFTDKAATNELARLIGQLISYRAAGEPAPPDLQRRADKLPPDVVEKLAKWDVLDAKRLAAAVPLTDLAERFRDGLLDAGRTRQHAEDSHARVVRVIAGCRFKWSPDVKAEPVSRLLASFRDGSGPKPPTVEGKRGPKVNGCGGVPMSQAGANHHLTAFKAFVRWLLAHEHARDTTAMQGVLRVKPVTVTHRPHERRAMKPDELQRLLGAAEAGPLRNGLDGPSRALLYRVASTTGLRAGELRRLKRADLHLPADDEAATVTVRAASGKNRKAATLPLRPDVAAELRTSLIGVMPAADALEVPNRSHAAAMLRADLADARHVWLAEAGDDAAERINREASDFLLDVDHNGRVLDFHALPHTFVTGLASAGVSLKVPQTLARHGDARLTLNVYAHADADELAAGVAMLPDTIQPAAAASATGRTVAAEQGEFHGKTPAFAGVEEEGRSGIRTHESRICNPFP